MASRVLMVTGSHDRTCDYLIRNFPEISFFRLNVDEFSKYSISVSEYGFKIDNEHSSITAEHCTSILYRKPIPEDLHHVFDQKYHNFAHSEAFALVEGIVESFDGPCLSKPSVMRRANNKIVQLKLAAGLGFNIPSSLITNSTDALGRFHPTQSIVKPLATGIVFDGEVKEFVQTNLLDSTINTSQLKFAPAYFQEYIEKDYELRVTMVDSDCYAVKIESSNKIDWRKNGNEVSYSPYALPKNIRDKSSDFMKQLGMQFGCFDFMVKNGVFFFLEMNANGQWAWLDHVTNCEISRSIIKFLTR